MQRLDVFYSTKYRLPGYPIFVQTISKSIVKLVHALKNKGYTPLDLTMQDFLIDSTTMKITYNGYTLSTTEDRERQTKQRLGCILAELWLGYPMEELDLIQLNFVDSRIPEASKHLIFQYV